METGIVVRDQDAIFRQSAWPHRIREWLKLEGTSESNTSSSRDAQSRVPRAVPRQILKISREVSKHFTAFLDSLCQCSLTCMVTKCFLMLRQNILHFILHPYFWWISGHQRQSWSVSNLITSKMRPNSKWRLRVTLFSNRANSLLCSPLASPVK